MTALIVLGSIAALFFILFFASVSVRVRIDDEIKIKIRYLFVGISLPKQEKEPEKEEQPKEEAKEETEPKEKKKGAVGQLIEEQGLSGALSELSAALKSLLKKVGRLVGHIRVRRFKLLAVAASTDPAVTAVEYGAVCAAVFPLLSGLQSAMKWNTGKTEASVKSDFLSDKPEFMLDTKVKLRVWFILVAGVGALLELIKLKMKMSTQNKETT